ncbi:RHO4 protein [Pestalotiopsis sp. IQ-011]
MVSSLLLTAALAAGAAAAPASSLPGHRKAGFTVNQVRAVNHVRHGPSAVAKTLLKFGKTPSDDLLATIKAFKADRLAITKRTNGSAVTTPEQSDIEYLTPVSIGTPAQTLNLDFDSGSSDLWVFSSDTQSSDVSGQSIYSPEDSSTSSELSGEKWDISYGDGSTSSGTVYTDVVAVGGVSFDAQAVEVAEQVSDSFTEDSDNDGLLGLAFSTLNTVTPTAQKTFFDNIRESLDSSLWTADLKNGEPGTYNFGWIDDSLYTGDVAYTDVDSSDGFWSFTADSWSVGTASSGNTNSGSASSAAATPTSSATAKAATSKTASYVASTSASPSYPSGSAGSSSGPGSGFGGGPGSSDGGRGGFGSDSESSSSDSGFGDIGDLAEALSGLFGRASPTTGGSPSSSSSASASSTTLTGIADTGTTLAFLPSDVCESYYSSVSGAEYSSSYGGYLFSCDADLPDFNFVIGDTTITIPGDYVNYSAVDSAETQCYGGIQPDTDIGFSIFGDIALKAAFVVFKDDGSSTPQIGFANKDL